MGELHEGPQVHQESASLGKSVANETRLKTEFSEYLDHVGNSVAEIEELAEGLQEEIAVLRSRSDATVYEEAVDGLVDSAKRLATIADTLVDNAAHLRGLDYLIRRE